MNNYENELINNKKQQLSKEFYAKMEETKQNINLFANTNLNEDTSKDMIAYLVVENAKLIKENQQLKENYDRIYNENCKLREEHNITDISLLDENYKLKKQKDDVVEFIKEYHNYENRFKWCEQNYIDTINEIERMLGEIDD